MHILAYICILIFAYICILYACSDLHFMHITCIFLAAYYCIFQVYAYFGVKYFCIFMHMISSCIFLHITWYKQDTLGPSCSSFSWTTLYKSCGAWLEVKMLNSKTKTDIGFQSPNTCRSCAWRPDRPDRARSCLLKLYTAPCLIDGEGFQCPINLWSCGLRRPGRDRACLLKSWYCAVQDVLPQQLLVPCFRRFV